MTISTVQPGLRAVAHPIAVIGGHPIYPLQGGRGGGVRVAVGDDEGDDDDILDEDDDSDEDDDEDEDDEPDEEPENELPASMRGKRQQQKPQPRKTARRAADEDGDEGADEDTPAVLRRMEAALGKANREASRNRRAGKVMERLGIEDLPTWLTERGIDPDTGQPFGDDVVDPTDEGGDEQFDEFDDRRRDDRADSRRRDRETTRQIRAAQQRAESAARDKYVPILAQLEATNALRAAGFNGSKAREEKLLRMIDPSRLDIHVDDEEFEIEGLDEQITELVEDFPELFTPPRRETRTTDRRGTATRTAPARRASSARDVDGGERGRPQRKSGGWLDQVAAEMDRRGR